MTDSTRKRECRCGRDGVAERGQCAVREGWGALRPGTFCRRSEPSPDATTDPNAHAREFELNPGDHADADRPPGTSGSWGEA